MRSNPQRWTAALSLLCDCPVPVDFVYGNVVGVDGESHLYIVPYGDTLEVAEVVDIVASCDTWGEVRRKVSPVSVPRDPRRPATATSTIQGRSLPYDIITTYGVDKSAPSGSWAGSATLLQTRTGLAPPLEPHPRPEREPVKGQRRGAEVRGTPETGSAHAHE